MIAVVSENRRTSLVSLKFKGNSFYRTNSRYSVSEADDQKFEQLVEFLKNIGVVASTIEKV